MGLADRLLRTESIEDRVAEAVAARTEDIRKELLRTMPAIVTHQVAESDGYAYQLLTGAQAGTGSPVPDVWMRQALRDSAINYESHGLAYMIVARMVALIFEAGFEYQLTVPEDFPEGYEREIRKRLDEFFYSEDADLQDRAQEFVLETLLAGEHGWRVTVDEVNGRVRISDVCRADVVDVLVRADDPRTLGGVRYKDAATQKTQDLKAMVVNPETGFLEGDVLYMRLDTRASKRRGSPILQRIIDELRVEKDFRIKAALRTLVRMSTNMTVTVKGASPDQVLEYAKADAMPGIPHQHTWYQSENVERDFTLAKLEAYEVTQMIKTLVTVIAGSMGMPISWFGFGDGTNYSTASAQQEPAAQDSRRIKRGFLGTFEKLLYFVVDAAIRARMVAPNPYETVTVTDDGGNKVVKRLRECITITVTPRPLQSDEPGTAPLAATNAALDVVLKAQVLEREHGMRVMTDDQIASLLTFAGATDGTRIEVEATDIERTPGDVPEDPYAV